MGILLQWRHRLGIAPVRRMVERYPSQDEGGMKVNINLECTPEEARAFFGLPDVTRLNDQLVEEMSRRMSENMAAMEPDALMRSWMTMGGEWQKQFMSLMGQAGSGKTGS
jgi:hypothetical protein